MRPSDELTERIVAHAIPLTGRMSDWDALLDRVGDARLVLLGEGSHGTLEFYRARAEITSRLIEERGFTAVAAEADWPDAARVDAFVRCRGEDGTPEQALEDFRRFPTWMWRNETVVRFVRWLQARNARRPVPRHAGFYGLDLYSLTASAEAVLAYLDREDPEAAARARERYGCLDHASAEHYGRSVAFGMRPDCEDEVIRQLAEIQSRAADRVQRLRHGNGDARFFAEQNARVVRNAERYYREMFQGRTNTWNLRDAHMAEILAGVLDHLGQGSRVVVWAHNSHLGDARATQMGRRGELNLGELCRRAYDGSVVNVGFTTHAGTVSAARDWGGPVETRVVNPSLSGSYERLFHDTGLPAFLLDTHADEALRQGLAEERLERAIGVIYRPETERQSHYFHADLSAQFDVVVHLDETHAVTPLEHHQRLAAEEAPETWPSGF